MRRNFLDKTIEFFSPGYALNRMRARVVLDVANKQLNKLVEHEKRKYDGASKGRHYSEWRSSSLSPNQEVLRDLSLLRERSRDLGRNNPYAINAVRTIRNNVVGTGIVPSFLPREGKIGKNQMSALKAVWAEWAGKTMCDYEDMNTFSGLQSLVMKVVIESGECLVRRVRTRSDEYLPLRLQLLEGDYIDGNQHTGVWASDGTMIYYGIKISKTGKRLGYYIYKQHPSEFSAESEYVPAEDIVHVYEVERPGQMRGVPLSCGVMLRLKDLDDYEFTERIRNKVAAAFAIFVTDNSIQESGPKGRESDLERVEPGMIKELLPGQDIKVAQPPTVQGFGDYVKNNLRGISAGFGTSYESLTNDYSNVNFSSGRMGFIEANRNHEHLQWNLIIPRMCDKVFPWFVEACQFKGIISFSVSVTARWTPPRREMIDPYKEVQALKEGIRACLFSWQDTVRTYGVVPEDLMEELKQDKEMFDKLGLMPTIDPRFDSNRPPGEPDEKLLDQNKD